MKKQGFRYSLYSLALALFFGGMIMWATGADPFTVYMQVIRGSFGSFSGVMGVLAYMIPLIFTGLSAVVAFQGGVFNIGAEGQLLVGGLAAVLVGVYLDLPWPIPLLIALMAGFVAGGIWALIPTVMVGRNLAALFVGTVMMNSIGSSFCEYLVKYHFLREGASTTETNKILDGAVLPRFYSNTQMNYGIILAVICVLLVAGMLYRTPAGFGIRMIGTNPVASEQAGINVYRKTMFTMFISGGIAGLAGAVQCLAIYGRWMLGFSPGYGWDGITVATLALLNPFAVIVTAMFFGMLRSASISMNLGNSVPIDMITVLQGLVVIFVATAPLWTTLSNVKTILVEKIRKQVKMPGCNRR